MAEGPIIVHDLAHQMSTSSTEDFLTSKVEIDVIQYFLNDDESNSLNNITLALGNKCKNIFYTEINTKFLVKRSPWIKYLTHNVFSTEAISTRSD